MPHDPLPEVAAFQAFLTGRVWVFGDIELSATLNAAAFYQRAGYGEQGIVVHRLPTGMELQCIRMTKSL